MLKMRYGDFYSDLTDTNINIINKHDKNLLRRMLDRSTN